MTTGEIQRLRFLTKKDKNCEIPKEPLQDRPQGTDVKGTTSFPVKGLVNKLYRGPGYHMEVRGKRLQWNYDRFSGERFHWVGQVQVSQV